MAPAWAMNCMLCASTGNGRIDSNKYLMLWCKACQFGCLSGEFSSERIRTFYDVSGDYYTRAKTDQQASGTAVAYRGPPTCDFFQKKNGNWGGAVHRLAAQQDARRDQAARADVRTIKSWPIS